MHPRLTRGVAALLLATPAFAGAQVLVTPPLTGPHGVGRHPITWIDPTRRDPVDSTRPRALRGMVWYPAGPSAPAADDALEPALDSAWAALREKTLAPRIGARAAAAMHDLRVRAVTDAPFAARVGRAPVLLLLPGNGWLATEYSVMAEDLASHGYLVVGVTPTGFADIVRFDDGHVVNKVLGNGAAIGTDQAIAQEDARFVLRQLAAMDSDATPYHGRLDLGRVGALGHSLGGSTAFVAAARDTIVRAALNYDGDAMGTVVDVRPKVPLLLVSSDNPSMGEAPAGRDSMWYVRMGEGLARSEMRRTGEWLGIASASAWARRIRIHGTHHLDFTDAALAASLITAPDQRWMKWGGIDGAQGLSLAARVTRAFFDQALRGVPGGSWLCDTSCASAALERVPER